MKVLKNTAQFVLILLVFISSQDSPLSLTCADITGAPTWYLSNCTLQSEEVTCRHYFQDKYRFSVNITKFTILEENILVRNDNISSSFCLGVHHISRLRNIDTRSFTTQVDANFDRNKSTGIMSVDHNCWQNNRSSLCIHNVTILEEIWALGIFQYTPEEEQFWNFQSPMYACSFGWFRSLIVHSRQYQDHLIDLKWVENLQNTSIHTIRVLGAKKNLTRPFLLKDMPEMKYCNLIDTSIRAFHKDSFTGTPKLQDLRLGENKLYGIPYMMKNLPNLKVLDLSNNHKRFYILESTLSRISNLEYLSITGMNIVWIPKPFPYLPKLKVLNISRCGISILEDDAFRNLPALHDLNMRGNNLQYINENVFSSLQNLRYLNLDNNELQQWPLLYSYNLETLSLNGNHLSTFHNLGDINTTVKHLYLSRNKFSQWDDIDVFSYNFNNKSNPFGATSKQTQLHLQNHIEELECRNDLHFETNQESSLSTTTKWVDNIYLSSNYITVVTKAMAQSFDGLQSVQLKDNPFDCNDCRMADFQHWLNTTRTQVDYLVCASPYKKKGEAILDIVFDEEFCQEKKNGPWINFGIPFGVIFFAVLIGTVLVYSYRSEIAFMMYLHKIRRNSKKFAEERYKKCVYDAFVCYSGKNRRFVWRSLVPLLENSPERYKLCLHDRDFRLGARISDNIVRSIEYSRKAIIILSNDLITSKWCKWELEITNHKMFNDDRRFLILIQLEPLDSKNIPRHLKYFMETRTFLEWFQEDSKTSPQEVFSRLKEALGQSIFLKNSEEASLISDVASTSRELLHPNTC